MKKLIILLPLIFGCATYHFGKGERTLPGGYDRVAVPVFANKTQEVGIEPYFTEALRTEFERSKIATVTNRVDAQLILEGTIVSVSYAPTIQINSQSTALLTPKQLLGAPNPNNNPSQVLQTNPLPSTAVLNTQYSVTVIVKLQARKNSDSSILWSSEFSSARQYLSPLLGTPQLSNGSPGINTASPLYNQSSRVDMLSRMAKDMMSEAHDRITENF